MNKIRDAEPPPQPAVKRIGHRKEHYWWVLALIPTIWGISQAFGLAGAAIAVAAFVIVGVSNLALTRCGLDGEKIVGGIIGVLGGVFGAVTMLTVSFPSSALWMSGLVCDGSYHLSTSTGNYACVSGENVYDVNDLMVRGLLAALIVIVLCPVVVIGILIWRRMRRS